MKKTAFVIFDNFRVLSIVLKIVNLSIFNEFTILIGGEATHPLMYPEGTEKKQYFFSK